MKHACILFINLYSNTIHDNRQCTHIPNSTGVIFNSLGNNDFDYTIRLRHEVIGNSWNTENAAPEFETPGPRVENKYVHTFTE